MRKVSNELLRKCISCEEIKIKEEFQIPSDIKTGRGRNTCNVCRVAQIRKWADKNRECVNENQRNYNRTINGRMNLLFNAARNRAKIRKQEFTLTKDHVLNGLQGLHCQKTFIPFDFNSHGKNYQSPYAPSIDKIDPFGIYENNNVQYVCWWYNISKQQWSEDVLFEMCRKVARLYP